MTTQKESKSNLLTACEEGNVKLVETYLKNGENVNRVQVEGKEEIEWTPLIKASCYGHMLLYNQNCYSKSRHLAGCGNAGSKLMESNESVLLVIE